MAPKRTLHNLVGKLDSEGCEYSFGLVLALPQGAGWLRGSRWSRPYYEDSTNE